MISELMQTIASTAQQGLPLPPALRDLGTPLALTLATRLEAGSPAPMVVGDGAGLSRRRLPAAGRRRAPGR